MADSSTKNLSDAKYDSVNDRLAMVGALINLPDVTKIEFSK